VWKQYSLEQRTTLAREYHQRDLPRVVSGVDHETQTDKEA